jgi:hypothetical protein
MVEVLCYKKVTGSSPDEVTEFFQFSFQMHHGLGIYSASNRNEYQKIFLGVKRGWRVMLAN